VAYKKNDNSRGAARIRAPQAPSEEILAVQGNGNPVDGLLGEETQLTLKCRGAF
jgi:hypothetical protein